MAKQAKKSASGETPVAAWLENYFGLKEQGTDIRTEFIAGLTTFLTMVYIVFVNPAILSKAGMDSGAVFVATCVAAAVSTMVMALYANYPIALAPGMGINAFFAFTVVLTYKYTWQQALAAVFCSGVLFFLISVFRIRQYVIEFDPAKPEARDLGRRRPVPRHHRARGSPRRGGAAGDPGHARRFEKPGRDPDAARLRADHRRSIIAASSAAR